MARRYTWNLLHKCEDHRWCLRKGHYEHTLPSIPEDREFWAAKGLLLLRLPAGPRLLKLPAGGKLAIKHQPADQHQDQADQDQAAAHQVHNCKTSTCKRKLLSIYISESKHQRHKLRHKKQKLIDQKNVELLTSSTLPPRPAGCSSNMANQFLPSTSTGTTSCAVVNELANLWLDFHACRSMREEINKAINLQVLQQSFKA